MNTLIYNGYKSNKRTNQTNKNKKTKNITNNQTIQRLYLNPSVHTISLLPMIKGTSLSRFKSKITPRALETGKKNTICSKSFAIESPVHLILI